MSLGLQTFRSAIRVNEIYNEYNAKTTEELDKEVKYYERVQQERSRIGLVKKVIDLLNRGIVMSFDEYKLSKRILSERQPN